MDPTEAHALVVRAVSAQDRAVSQGAANGDVLDRGSDLERVHVAWDYLCPFSKNLSTGLIELAAGRNIDLRFTPFSLIESQLPPGEVSLWDRPPESRWGSVALRWAVAARDSWPARFHEFHLAIYAARFEDGRDSEDESVVRDIARRVRLPRQLDAIAASDRTTDVLRREHVRAAEEWRVFGVPTVRHRGVTTFVRVLDASSLTAANVMNALGWNSIHEMKRVDDIEATAHR